MKRRILILRHFWIGLAPPSWDFLPLHDMYTTLHGKLQVVLFLSIPGRGAFYFSVAESAQTGVMTSKGGDILCARLSSIRKLLWLAETTTTACFRTSFYPREATSRRSPHPGNRNIDEHNPHVQR